MELSIIIVDYKSRRYSLPLILELEKNLKNLNFEIIFVDNDPAGDLAAVVANQSELAKKSNLKVIKAKKNGGFGAGNNLGAKAAKGKYLLLLNPDTKIRDDAIEKMLDFLARHSEVGALVPRVLQSDGKTPQRHFFGRFQSFSNLILRNQAGKLIRKSPEFFYAEMITGAAMMLRRDLFEKLGGFDQKFFMYFEDEDLCRRISKLGLKNAVLTSAKIIHTEGQSSTSPQKKNWYQESQNYYWQKYYGKFKTFLMKTIRAPYVLIQTIKN